MIPQLSRRQIQVADLIIEGLTNKQISDRINIAEKTVKAHVTALLKISLCGNRTHFAIEYFKEKLADKEFQDRLNKAALERTFTVPTSTV